MKLALAKLLATTAGILFSRWIHRRAMPNFSLSIDYVRFLQVTGENFPADASNLCEDSNIRAREDSFKLTEVSIYPVPKSLTRIHKYFLQVIVKSFEFDFVPKRMVDHGSFNALSRNVELGWKLSTLANWTGKSPLPLFLSFCFSVRGWNC